MVDSVDLVASQLNLLMTVCGHSVFRKETIVFVNLRTVIKKMGIEHVLLLLLLTRRCTVGLGVHKHPLLAIPLLGIYRFDIKH